MRSEVPADHGLQPDFLGFGGRIHANSMNRPELSLPEDWTSFRARPTTVNRFLDLATTGLTNSSI
jgi:hypothetical protein